MGNFDDIRPYTDAELPAALRRIADWNLFPQILHFVYPNANIAEKRSELMDITTVHHFQSTVMNDAILRIIATTTTGFTHSGLEHLRHDVPYLFISNHRDITLDAFLLQHLLLKYQGDTSHIVFGNNLLSLPVMNDLFRCNKMIPMARGGTPRAFYNGLHHLSDYITHLITVEHQSVWIAQNNGRAKDGHDITAPALVKMLALGGHKKPLETLADLHIVPLSISYEWDPCDTMKANELYCRQHGGYQKASLEDLRSVATGIIGPKGHVHLNIGSPLTRNDLIPPQDIDLYNHVAAVLDRAIQTGYRLTSTNHIAYSLLTHQEQHGRHTGSILSRLQQRLETLPSPELQQIMLEAYAAPIISQHKYTTST